MSQPWCFTVSDRAARRHCPLWCLLAGAHLKVSPVSGRRTAIASRKSGCSESDAPEHPQLAGSVSRRLRRKAARRARGRPATSSPARGWPHGRSLVGSRLDGSPSKPNHNRTRSERRPRGRSGLHALQLTRPRRVLKTRLHSGRVRTWLNTSPKPAQTAMHGALIRPKIKAMTSPPWVLLPLGT